MKKYFISFVLLFASSILYSQDCLLVSSALKEIKFNTDIHDEVKKYIPYLRKSKNRKHCYDERKKLLIDISPQYMIVLNEYNVVKSDTIALKELYEGIWNDSYCIWRERINENTPLTFYLFRPTNKMSVDFCIELEIGNKYEKITKPFMGNIYILTLNFSEEYKLANFHMRSLILN